MPDIKPGDTVQLKSGGPIMTVTEIENGKVWCTWFDASMKPTTGTFPAAALLKTRA